MKKIVPAPYIDQTERWVNGCESISSVMLLQAVGIDIDPDTFIARDLPHAPYWEQDGKLYGPDPWQVYPGDPHDHTGYGCYSPCIVKALNSALEHEGAADKFEVVDESGKTAAQLCSYLDAGMPVVFWATRAVTAQVANTPLAVMVLMSAWIPAPPLESLPAMVNAVLMVITSFLFCIQQGFIKRYKVVPPVYRCGAFFYSRGRRPRRPAEGSRPLPTMQFFKGLCRERS